MKRTSVLLAAIAALVVSACRGGGADRPPPDACEPDCLSRDCGDDGCGGSCGGCAAGSACEAGACVPVQSCVPACAGKACGDDGCGGSCGSCPAGTACDAASACAPLACVPSCSGKACGDDGCGGSCGDCGPATACTPAGACASISCPGALVCLEQLHVAYRYECTRTPSGAWSCDQLAPMGWFELVNDCRKECAGGESACQENDSDVGTACRRCEDACLPAVDVVCAGEAPGSCPAPCSCR